MLSLRKISINIKMKQIWKNFGSGYLEHERSNAIYTMRALAAMELDIVKVNIMTIYKRA